MSTAATVKKPVLDLSNCDSNAFAILGRVQKAARLAKWSKEQIDALMEKATSGDYNDLLNTCMEQFDVRMDGTDDDVDPEDDDDDDDEFDDEFDDDDDDDVPADDDE